MLREEVELVKTMIENAFKPLQQQMNATFDELKKELAGLKKENDDLKKKMDKPVGMPSEKKK